MSRSQISVGIAVALAIAVVVLFFIFNPFFSKVSQSTSSTNSIPTITDQSSGGAALNISDLTIGTGASANVGDTITVNYTGKLDNGTVFDSSVGKAPFKFVLGAGQVIPGWDQGLLGMKVGGKRILIIPASMAYGSQGSGPIPPNATLTFEVDLLKVEPAGSAAPLPEGSNF